MAFCPHCGQRVEEGDTLCRSCGKPAGAALKKQGIPKVLWVVFGIGCAVLFIAFMGIVAAILIPNFLDALQKAKQKRSIADLRNVGTALVSYQVDHGGLPPGDSYDEVVAALDGEYMDQAPRLDGWENPFRYECLEEMDDACQLFRLASAGRDGEFERYFLAEYPKEGFHPTDYDRDLVFESVEGLIQYPSRTPRPERGP